jgi:ribosomal protein S18 acetylase RimI-like enzyme
MSTVRFREASSNEAETIAGLIVRLKRLNEEFDSHLKVREDVHQNAVAYVKESLDTDHVLLLVAEASNKIVGVLRAEMRDRLFYAPPEEGVIVDFYLLPEYRRHGTGRKMIDEATQRLRKMGAKIIIAEFPLQNKIASSFYEKLGFRGTIGLYAREAR